MDRFDPRQDRLYDLRIVYHSGEVEYRYDLPYVEANLIFDRLHTSVREIELLSQGV
jgi:hypothetical protein